MSRSRSTLQHGTVALIYGHGYQHPHRSQEPTPARLQGEKRGPAFAHACCDTRRSGLTESSQTRNRILTHIVPRLPASIHTALSKDRLRCIFNSFLLAVEQARLYAKEGVIRLGNAWNMRHPLTGGGMIVALSDVVLLAPMLAAVLDLADWNAVVEVLRRWHWAHKVIMRHRARNRAGELWVEIIKYRVSVGTFSEHRHDDTGIQHGLEDIGITRV
jgi:squalene monooxygenase